MWKNHVRPGYFGGKRDAIIAQLNADHGTTGWRLAWVVNEQSYSFEQACKRFYEESYFQWLSRLPKFIDEICSYGECYDNHPSNIGSGLDYTIQESYSTHIQDIAVRNVIHLLDRKFEGPGSKLLEIRGRASVGFKYSPGKVPFYDPHLITLPSLVPDWAKPDSVEDFWQSNKWIQVMEEETK